MGLFDRLFRSRHGWSLEGLQPPWGDRESIYSHLEEHLAERGLAPGGERLPDEDRVARATGGLSWAPGAMDGVLSHHGSRAEDEDRVDAVLDALLAVLEDVSEASLGRLYHGLCDGVAIETVDELLERLGERLPDDPAMVGRLGELAEWLVRRAADREPVKLGIALLGRFHGERYRELFMTLGRHEELTLYAAVALNTALDDAEPSLWELARHVRGWGRIHLVERLAKSNDPAIRRWLLLEGYQNDVMIEYLAYTCAVAGDLRGALMEEAPAPELLDAAAELVEALIAGGPVEEMDDYADGPAVIDRLVELLLEQRELTLTQLVAVGAIQGYLDEELDWCERARAGWSPELRQRVRARCDALVKRPQAAELVRKALEQPSGHREYWLASTASELVGVDAWPLHMRRLEAGEDDAWFRVVDTTDAARAERVVELASERLLAHIAAGPADELGLGPEWRHHGSLDFVLQGLVAHPGLGWPLVSAALESPVIRNRHGALRVLAAWPRERWPPEAEPLLERARAREPVAAVSEAIDRLLAGEPLADEPD